jgi:glycosyltransferase involved in cell wall biosynthesis
MPGCREVVRHRYNGLLIPPRNAHALAAAIEALLDADTLRQAMGARSRVHVKNTFSLAQVADAYAAIYRRVLAETAARADFQRRRFPCNELHHQV